MMIPDQFPSYVGEHAVFIVTGSEEAKILMASDGDLTEIAAFRVTPEIFDAKEKSIYPLKTHEKQMRQKAFVAELATQVMRSIGKTTITHAYLFTPSEMKNIIHDALPASVTTALRKTITGNYLDKSPVELLTILHA